MQVLTHKGIAYTILQLANSFNVASRGRELRRTTKNNPGKKAFLHYAEVFNRPSETFIYDFINRVEKYFIGINLILCDSRKCKNKEASNMFITCLEHNGNYS